jgi:hypothetical protein
VSLIKASRKGPCVAAMSIGLPIPVVVLLASFGLGVTSYNVLLFLPALALIARALVMAIGVDADGINVVSWFRTRRIDRFEIISVSVLGYSGMINRNSESGWDPLYLFCRMIMLTMEGGERSSCLRLSQRKGARRRSLTSSAPQLERPTALVTNLPSIETRGPNSPVPCGLARYPLSSVCIRAGARVAAPLTRAQRESAVLDGAGYNP